MNPAAVAFYQSLFANARRAGVHHLPQAGVAELIDGAQAAGCMVFRVDFSRATGKDDMLDAIAKSLAFPDWFGANWDALADCLMDMAWRPAVGYVVILDHADHVHALAEADFVALLRVFDDVAEQWRDDEVPFWCLPDLLADGIAWLPTLAQPSAGQ